MSAGTQLSRRQLLRNLATLTGGVLSAPLTSAILAGATSASSASELKILNEGQLQLVAAIVDTIIPDTDTPGASAAGVHNFVHLMLSEWYNTSEREKVLRGLKAIDEQAMAAASRSFTDCTSEQQLAVLQAFDKAAYKEGGKDHFFRMLKEMTVVGYYTSEIGASEELRYEPVPGPYEGCVPFSKIGRTWAL